LCTHPWPPGSEGCVVAGVPDGDGGISYPCVNACNSKIASGQCTDPCDGKACGDSCSDSAQPNTAMFCHPDGSCTATQPVCAPPWTLHWDLTCGDPACRVSPDGSILPTGAPPCGSTRQGDPCTGEGALCDPSVGCGGNLKCVTTPIDRSMCPISSAKFKKEIDYLTESDLQKVAASVQTIKLATYHYKDQRPEEQKHLGFIIEDNPDSPAVYTSRERVDLYGYASMAIAAVQVQNRQIQALEREIEELKAELSARSAR
jgi:hypothetical protein